MAPTFLKWGCIAFHASKIKGDLFFCTYLNIVFLNIFIPLIIYSHFQSRKYSTFMKLREQWLEFTSLFLILLATSQCNSIFVRCLGHG